MCCWQSQGLDCAVLNPEMILIGIPGTQVMSWCRNCLHTVVHSIEVSLTTFRVLLPYWSPKAVLLFILLQEYNSSLPVSFMDLVLYYTYVSHKERTPGTLEIESIHSPREFRLNRIIIAMCWDKFWCSNTQCYKLAVAITIPMISFSDTY